MNKEESFINVLMCTYNGGNYLREQLDSLLNQTYTNYCITIRDDGSTDDTRGILEEYAAKDSRIRLLAQDHKNLGYPDCFWHLLKCAERADYYAFCDQDDVWNVNKLEIAATCLGKEKDASTLPLLYAHDYELCDSKLNTYGENSFPDFEHMVGRKMMFYSYLPGFSMVFNEAMRKRLEQQEMLGRNAPHDLWTLWNAFFAGKIIHGNQKLVKYRRHEKAETPTGTNSKLLMIKTLLKREIFGGDYVRLCCMADTFADLCRGDLSAQEYREWKTLSFRDKGVMKYLRRLFYPHRIKPTVAGEIALRILFLTGR